MDPEDERSRPPATEDRPATYTLRRMVPGRLGPVWMSASRGPEYSAGFRDGWEDRAEYERRTGPVEPLTFDDGVELGRLLGPAPITDQAPRATGGLTAEDLAKVEEIRCRTRKWLGWDS